MKTITCRIPNSIYESLVEKTATGTTNRDYIITEALSQYLGQPVHTLFQVSTSAALVEGLYQGAVQVSRLLEHGDFGLGTFVDLLGEMVIVDAVCYQALSDGTVQVVDESTLVPYAVVTRFTAEHSVERRGITSYDDLRSACDSLRVSDNLFYAFRISGTFASITTRVMKPVRAGMGLRDAAAVQQEFAFEATPGTLVGLWSPSYAASVSVPGYHFHFLSDDRRHGGHVLACSAQEVRIEKCEISEMRVSLPETAEFLQADLSRSPAMDLMSAEQNHNS